MRFFEEIKTGEESALGKHRFERGEIIAFAERWDPQRFHLEQAAAETGPFGALTASGWHTACVWMKLYVAHLMKRRQARADAGETVPKFGASPGFRDLEWRRPVFVGDELIYSTRVIEKRELASRPDWGLVISHNQGVNQHGELAFAFIGQIFVERSEGRDPSPA